MKSYSNRNIARDEDGNFWTRAGSVANLTFVLHNATEIAAFEVVLRNGPGDVACEPKKFWVDGADGTLRNTTFLFNKPIVRDKIFVIVNETYGDTETICLDRFRVLRAEKGDT
jgi:hypothetical protein